LPSPPESSALLELALVELARGLSQFENAFGAKGDVDPVRHLLATAAG
jgi:hypothetical protein